MSDPFSRLIPEAQAFLSDLSRHNTRDWFTAQKSRYEAQLKAPASLLLGQMAQTLAGPVPLTPKLFRPQRDVRFSADKTPYHTHLHMMWSLGGPGPARPALFFGLSPDYVKAGGGVMAFDKAGLTRWRATIDGSDGPAMAAHLDRLAAAGLQADAPELKRVPAPHPKDHPRGELLRRKGIAVWRDLPPEDHATPTAALTACFRDLQPFLTRLQAVL